MSEFGQAGAKERPLGLRHKDGQGFAVQDRLLYVKQVRSGAVCFCDHAVFTVTT
jgi:hypothetical protein